MRRWWQQTAGGLPATFWYLWAGTLINRAGAFVVILLSFYLHDTRGLDPQFIGLVIGLIGAGGAVGVLVGGQLADRWGRRRTLLLAHVGTAALVLGLGFARDRWTILAVAVALGTMQNMARPASSAMMVDIVGERDRLRAFSLNYWVVNLGFSCAALLGGFAAEFDPMLIFVVDAATTLITALIIFVRVPESRPDTARPQPHEPAPAGQNPFRDPIFMGLVGLTFLSAMVFMQHLSSLPLVMQQDGLSGAAYGVVIALNGILIVAGQLFVPKLIGGRDRSRVLAMAMLILGVGFGLTAFAHQVWLYAITVLIWTLGEMLQSPANSTLIAELSPAAARGRYQGAFSLAFSAAAFAAPLLGGFVIQHFGGGWLWLGCLALAIVAAAANLAAGPARNRRVAALQAPDLVRA